MLSQLFTLLSRLKSPKPSQTESSKSSALSVSSPAPSPESSSSPSWITRATKQIRSDEGEVLHAYEDHLGYVTIGVGRLIDKRRGGGISKEESSYFLGNDIKKRITALQEKLPFFDRLDDARKGVLLNMSFQMGVSGLMKFKNTLAMVQAGEYDKAAANMLKSKWARQTPNRAQRMAKQMRTGRWVSG